MNGLRNPVSAGLKMHHEVRGRPGKNAIVIGRVALGLRQRLGPSLGASVPVRIARTRAVKSGDECLGLESHFVHGAMAEVDDLLRMSERPLAGHWRAPMASVGSCSGISLAQCGSHLLCSDHAGESTVAHGLEAPVPVRREPYLETNVGIRRRMNARHDPAERGQLHRRGSAKPLHSERPCGDRLRQCDLRMVKLERGEALARRLRGGSGSDAINRGEN